MYTSLCLMFFAAIALLNLPELWAYLYAHLPIVICGLGAALAPSLQLIKKLIPAITGWKALAVNFVMSTLAVFAVTPADQFWTVAAWMHVIQISGIAAAIHGTTKALAQGSSDPTSAQLALNKQSAANWPNPAPQRRTATGQTPTIAELDQAKAKSATTVLVLLLLCSSALVGCVHQAQPATPPPLPAGAVDQIDATANTTLQTIQAFMIPVIRDIKNGKLQATPQQRSAINTLDDVYNKASFAELAYRTCMTTTAAAVTATANPITPSATCLVQAGLTAAMKTANTAFTEAQASLGSSLMP